MELFREIGAWAAVLLLVGVAAVVSVREGRQRRAQRRSVVAGREVVYGRGGHSPRSGLWAGLLFAWIGTNMAMALLLVGVFPPRWRVAAIAGIAAVSALAFVVALRFLLDFARTEVVEGRVLERKILYDGEDHSDRSYWIAVEDGRRARIAGTPVSSDDYARVVAGAWVRLHLTPRGRQVKRLEVVEFPGSVNGFPAEPANLLVTPAQAAQALRSPVEVVPVAPEVPNTRRYVYVPPGRKVTNGTALPPALHVTEAFDREAADEAARRAIAGGRRTWHHGHRGVFQSGSTYIMTWGDGALLIRGQVDVNEVDGIGRLAHSLKPPRPGSARSELPGQPDREVS